ncbi:diguanylate cyclase (GGDEF)-like protein [Paenibacillus endophyticus]|uniref:Diguanylate cyclase (GGDEF)-like protein n=1 Tax=Paenibacillus endophyticus TaxID=1294268 RepID=A0A7W5G9N3_9BACL|nr:diguanylate cyclase [Paenibacillus endophyticus]MBB3151493.1 diguanylate cyclase (GGDEF)-like protein [Paenibacillus endophyticus]
MNGVGVGLFNRDMLRSIKERWHEGGIGVIYVRFRLGNAAAENALQMWESEEKALFWRQRLEWDYFFLIDRKQKDEPIIKVIEKSLERLYGKLRKVVSNTEKEHGAEHEVEVNIGMSTAFPPATGRSSEAVVYRMLLDAMEHSAYNVSLGRERKDAGAAGVLSQAGYGLSAVASETVIQQDLTGNHGRSVRIGTLAVPFPVFPARARVSEVAYLFDTNAKAQGAVIVDQGRPIGILMKEKLHQMLAGQFGLPLYWNRPVERIMNNQPLIVDEQLSVEHVSQLAMAREFSQLYDVVLITKDGQMAGAASIRSILECMTTLRTEAARTANPLTGLPGNEEIQLELSRRIGEKEPFAVIYADLDYFKWYNDCFGFGMGDNLIRYLGELLRRELDLLGGSDDFIGHIGGDDFIAVTKSSLAEGLCEALIKRFDQGIKAFYGGVEVTSVEDRHGNPVEQEGVTLSLSLMMWDGRVPLATEEIPRRAAMLKKQAKALKGSICVMDHISGMHHGEERNRN